MSKKIPPNPKSISTTVGATFAVSLAAIPIANAADNPFRLNELSRGYMVAEEETQAGTAEEGQTTEGQITTEGKGSEGTCGGDHKTASEGKCGAGVGTEENSSEKPRLVTQ